MNRIDLNSRERILLVRLSSLGDIVHTLPALAALRRKKPQTRISWLVEPVGARLLQNFSGIDQVISIQLKEKGRLGNIHDLLSKWRGHFDLIVDFQGLLKSALLCRLLGSQTLGFARSNLREALAAVFYRYQAPPFPEKEHVIKKNLHLLSALEIEADRIEYPLAPGPVSFQLQTFFKENQLEKGSWLAVNSGGGWPSKVLDGDRLSMVVADLMRDLRPVLFYGNESERRLCLEVTERTGCLLAPSLDFPDLIHFLESASVLLSADTLALHLADALGKPSVAYFGPSSPRRNGSLLPGSISLIHQIPCSFCYRRKCDKMTCMQALKVEEISAAVRSLHEQSN